jgi:oligoribonuclease NrnB/cAMP/cGMP phosphodiesterase (DHH superfamily)
MKKRIRMKPLIITHKNCVDGCCSQAILRSRYGSDADYLELDHANLDPTKDKDAPKYLEKIFAQKDSEVVISDFCLNTEMIDRLLQQNNKVVILDHHASSIPFVEPFEKRMAAGEKLNLHINFAKTNDRSGSMLTWEYAYPDVTPPKAVEFVSDGDIWKFKFGDATKHFYTGLLETHGEPKDVPTELWDKLLIDNKLAEKIVEIGEPIHAQYMSEVMYYATKGIPVVLDGKPGLMVEAPKKYTSDLGNQLAIACDGFGLVYNTDEQTGVVRCSLRSVAPITVNDLAGKFGGGGHPQASAFRCKDMDEFNALLTKEGNELNQLSAKKVKP